MTTETETGPARRGGRALLAGLLSGALVVLTAIAAFAAGVFVGLRGQDNPVVEAVAPALAPTTDPDRGGVPDDLLDEFAPFWEVWDMLHEDYIDQPLDDAALAEGAISGMMRALGDRNTNYMSPSEFEIMSSDFDGDLEGIGAEVTQTGDFLEVVSPLPGSPAEEAGILPGDFIVAADDVDLVGMGLFEAISYVRGPAGSTVVLTVIRDGEELLFEITRYQITLPQVEGEMLEDDLAYVKINRFGNNATDELEDILGNLMAQNPAGVILDLRNNPGGDLRAAIEVSSQFIGESPIMYEEFGDGTREAFNHIPGGLATEVPLVVLINEGSASASEIVAAAVQEYDRGTLVGTTTFGKGTVQVWRPLRTNGGAVRITIARWLTPEGNWIHDEGVTPDIEVERTFEQFQAGEDPQLDAAIAVLLGEPVAMP